MERKTKINKWSNIGRILYIFLKYQIITKVMVGIIVLPIFSWFSSMMITMSGRTNVTSGDYLGFIFSFYGLLVVIVGIMVLIAILGIDINVFIIISALVEEGRINIKIKSVLKEAIFSLKIFFSPLGLIITLYLAFIFPLLNLGIRLGPFKQFKIPNFITSVIFNNALYSFLYGLTLFVLSVIGFIYILSVHFILIEGTTIIEGLKKSRLFMKKHWKKVLIDYFKMILKLLFVGFIILLLVVVLCVLIDYIISYIYSNDNVLVMMILFSIFEVIGLITFMFIPFIIAFLTKIYYRYNEREVRLNIVNDATELSYKQKNNKIRVFVKMGIVFIVFVIIIFNFLIAILFENHFNQIFDIRVKKEIVAHRAGGDLAVENSVKGIKEAIKEKASWAEIDVQRTKDNKYIINHDKTFSRVSGVDKTPMDMTLKEIKELSVKDEFNPARSPERVATFDEILNASKNKIGVFVELKGASADEKMVDDVVKIIKDKGMSKQCVILSLDYDIIKYTHKKYPQIKTGFLYFFSFGDLKDLKGDYLIMEEREATEENINRIHEVGKKAIVWTVNTPESIEKFVKSNVDGIITDHVTLLNDAMKNLKKKSHVEIIIEKFLNR